MNIDHSRELLYDYARGRLSEQERCSIEEQLKNSEDLRSELEKVTTYYAAIDETEPVTVPEHFLEKVHQRIDSRGTQSLLHRLLFPLHLKLPIEFAGVAATVALVIFIFIPQLEKKNYSEYEPFIDDDVKQVSPASQDETPGKSVAATSATEETIGSGQIPVEKKEYIVNKDVRPVSRVKQQLKSSVPKMLKSSAKVHTGVKQGDDKSTLPAAELISENAPVPALSPASAPALTRPSVTENDEIGMSEGVPAMAPVVQRDEPQKIYIKSEDKTSVRKRKIVSPEQKQMKSRSVFSEKSDAKEMALSMEFETTTASKDITVLLAKYGMRLTVNEFTGSTSNCSASGTPAAVMSFLREIKELSDVTLLKVVPENYNAALDSVIVEFSVKGKVE